MPLPPINPPLINSANPWATTEQDLKALLDCPHTGAVTTRTTLLHGFEHDDNIHQYTFFSSHNHSSSPPEAKDGSIPEDLDASLNTLGYSPIPLASYLATIAKISSNSTAPHRQTKPWIVSVTGSSDAVTECYRRISAAQNNIPNPLCMEINLSCPNIPDKPPPAYSRDSLAEYLALLAQERSRQHSPVPVGIKTPPYTYHDQFQTLITALLDASTSSASGCPIDFITATNTLGSSLLLSSTSDDVGKPAINSASGQGIGGMAGAPLHPLALGNVKTIRSMLDAHESLREVEVIGVGGVSDAAGAKRMRAVGAAVVGVGTALGRYGLGVFEGIAKG